MTPNPTFELVPGLDRLRPHEAIDETAVQAIIADLHIRRVFREPIWIARDSNVILNGHHRWAAMRAIGARRIPASVFDYLGDDTIHLDRWTPGEPISKSEVVEAESHRPPLPAEDDATASRRSSPPTTSRSPSLLGGSPIHPERPSPSRAHR